MSTVIMCVCLVLLVLACFMFGFTCGLSAGGYLKGYREGSESAYKKVNKVLDDSLERLKKEAENERV